MNKAQRGSPALLALAALVCCGPAPTPAPGACTGPLTVCTVAGTGHAQFDGDGRQALQTSLYLPLDVAIDAAGRLLILDWNNLRIRRVEPSGIVTTFAGTGIEGGLAQDGQPAAGVQLHHPFSMVFDRDFNLFVAGNHAPVVLRIDPTERSFVVAGLPDEEGYGGDGGPATQAKLTYPCGVTPFLDGFALADSGNHRLRRVAGDGTITALAGTGVAGFDGDGGRASEAKLNNPMRLFAVGARLLIADTGNHAIREIDARGTIRTLAGLGREGEGGVGGLAVKAGLRSPRAVVVGPDGLVYIADAANHRILRIAADGTLEQVAGTGGLGFSGDGGSALAATFNLPSGMTFGPGGDLFVADAGNHRVRRIVGLAQ